MNMYRIANHFCKYVDNIKISLPQNNNDEYCPQSTQTSQQIHRPHSFNEAITFLSQFIGLKYHVTTYTNHLYVARCTFVCGCTNMIAVNKIKCFQIGNINNIKTFEVLER